MSREAARNFGLGEITYQTDPKSPRMTTRSTQLTWLSPEPFHARAGHLATSMMAQIWKPTRPSPAPATSQNPIGADVATTVSAIKAPRTCRSLAPAAPPTGTLRFHRQR